MVPTFLPYVVLIGKRALAGGVAVTMGFLTAPSAIAPIQVHPSSELVTMLPMVMIPVYMVPLSIVLHIASLVKLHRDEAHVARGSGLINASA